MEEGEMPQKRQTSLADDDEKKVLSPRRLLLLLAAAIFLVEGGIMDMFKHIGLEQYLTSHHMLGAMLDASILVVIIFPVLYFFHYKPLNAFVTRISLNEKRYRNLINFSPDPILAHSEGKILFANPAALKAVGMDSEDQVVGRTFIDMVHPDYHKLVSERIEMIERDGVAAPLMEGKVRRLDGTEADMEWTSAPLLCDGRRAILTIARDITKRKKAEKELARTQFELAEAKRLASISRLSAGLAHEIKNPLNIISLSAQMLMMDENLPAETKESVKTMLEQTNRASLIIDRLKIFATGRPQEPAVFDLCGHLADIEKTDGDELAARGIALTVDLPEGPIMLRGNEEQLCEVCQHLLSNARDSVGEKMDSPGKSGREQDGWKPAITIRARASGGKAVISVGDTGAGVRKTDREKIFDPFFSTKPEGKGAGLGLPVALGIIESHGGTIEFESEEGMGAVFTVTLPLAGA